MELPVLFCEKVGGIGPADGVRRVLADLVCVFKLRQIDLLPGFGVQTELAGHLVKRLCRLLFCDGRVGVIGQQRGLRALRLRLRPAGGKRRIAGQMQRRFRVDAVPFFGVPAVKRHVFTLRSLHIQFVQAFSLLCFQRDRFASFAGIERQRINGLLKRQLGEAVFTCGADGQSKIVACKVLREIVCVAGQDRLLRRSADADVRLLCQGPDRRS